MRNTIIFLAIFILQNIYVYSDEGPTDESGGHYDRITGVYHKHDISKKELYRQAMDNARVHASSIDTNNWAIGGVFFGCNWCGIYNYTRNTC